MAARIVYLVERLGVAPASVLGLTFTNKAGQRAGGQGPRGLADIPIDVGDEVTVDTYHAFAADLVKAYGIRVGSRWTPTSSARPSSTRSCSGSSTASGSST